MFFDEIKKFNKTHLLTNIFWQREKQIREIYKEYSLIDLARLASCNLLLRRIMLSNDFELKEEINEDKINKIIETYKNVVQFEEDKQRLQAGTYTMIALVKYDTDHLERLPLVNSILVCPNESYERIMRSFAKHNIFSEKTGEEKMKEWKPQFVSPVHGSKKSPNSRETIKRFYELITNFYVAFFRNKVYFEAFKLDELEEINIDPFDLKIFATSYLVHDNIQSCTKFQDFRNGLILHFKGKFKNIMKYFVLSEENPTAFPFFLKIDDFIFISQAFTEFFSYPLHAVLNRDIFDEETEIRSKAFEQKIVKDEFEKKGYHYRENYIVKNKMEIDGIAISNSEVFVIEVKGWKSRRFIEEKTTKEQLDRDIKNAIDGIHISHNTGKIKQKVPLSKKVEWVIKNKQLLKINPSVHITGLLVINEQPTILEYKNCKVQFIDDFEFN
jgi:hypothetical protein